MLKWTFWFTNSYRILIYFYNLLKKKIVFFFHYFRSFPSIIFLFIIILDIILSFFHVSYSTVDEKALMRTREYTCPPIIRIVIFRSFYFKKKVGVLNV